VTPEQLEITRLRDLLRSARSALNAARPIVVAAARMKEQDARRCSIVGAATTAAWIDGVMPQIEQALAKP
jgi:hypothetical protein